MEWDKRIGGVSKLATALLFAAALTSAWTGAARAAEPDGEGTAAHIVFKPPIKNTISTQSFTYAQAVPPNVPVYALPSDEAEGLPPIRILDAGFAWVSLADPEPLFDGVQEWYRINPEGYVHADVIRFFEPSRFQGVLLSRQPDKPLAWIVYGARVSNAPGAAPLKNALWLPRYAPVTVFESRQMGTWIWYRIGENQWVEQRQLGIVFRVPRPEGIAENDKWIEVNLYEQTLAAYEGDRMVYATLVSTGLPLWPTPPGLFRIWTKAATAKMSGRDGFPDSYFLEDVPWIMYFNRSVALHTAYWHDRFGAPHSHGCVNLSPKDALWLYDWTTPAAGPGNWTLSNPLNPGTWVWVH